MEDINVDEVLSQLTLKEKVSLTAGRDFWHTTPVHRLNVPALRLSDGPNGVRGTTLFDGIPAACFPCATALGATFDSNLLKDVGCLLGQEAHAKGAHVLLGPTINIQRGPLGGRGFESFSEDPCLSGTLAGEYCLGVQSKNIICTVKHFVCNDQEHERMAVDTILTPRALREIYLMPFMLAIKTASPKAIMTAYNKINGTHVSENTNILDILRQEWRWEGLLMSDWYGTYSTSDAINAGLDLEMPGPTRWRTDALTHAVTSNKVKEHVLDARVRAVLDTIKLAVKSGITEDQEEKKRDEEEDRKLLRRAAADSIVLLKNKQNILPLDKAATVAVIGSNAKAKAICGGGSAALLPYYAVTPFDGIQAKCTEPVRFAQGAYGHKELPLIGHLLRTIDERTFEEKPGFSFRAYKEPPKNQNRVVFDYRVLTDSKVFLADYKNDNLDSDTFYVDLTGTFIPEEDGLYDFGIAVHGTAKLFIDGELLIDNSTNQCPGSVFFGSGTVEKIESKKLEAGKRYEVRVEFGTAPTSDLISPGIVSFGAGGVRLGGCKRLDPEASIVAAVKLASEVENVVLCAGLNGDWESEGFDRPDMHLPPYSDDLIGRVLAANPRTIVVLQSGTPVEMPWEQDADTLVQAWFGGNESGNAIADVLFGDVNPSGKLPLTFPARLEDNPTYLNFRSEAGRVLYGEDVYVGYRFFEKVGRPALFAFGHGLSYTTFEYSSLRVDTSGSGIDAHLQVSVAIKNTGATKGSEAVQIYVTQCNPSIMRPVKELKGFTKVELEAGERRTVLVNIEKKYACSFWDEWADKWVMEKDKYKLLVGGSSEGPFLSVDFEVEEMLWWLGL